MWGSKDEAEDRPLQAGRRATETRQSRGGQREDNIMKIQTKTLNINQNNTIKRAFFIYNIFSLSLARSFILIPPSLSHPPYCTEQGSERFSWIRFEEYNVSCQEETSWNVGWWRDDELFSSNSKTSPSSPAVYVSLFVNVDWGAMQFRMQSSTIPAIAINPHYVSTLHRIPAIPIFSNLSLPDCNADRGASIRFSDCGTTVETAGWWTTTNQK